MDFTFFNNLGGRLRHAWNAFSNRDPTPFVSGSSYYRRPDRIRLTRGNERSIVTAIFNRIGLDCSSIDIRHVQLDENDRFLSVIDSGLNQCLSLEANIDQSGRAFMQDAVMSMLDEGVVALVPVDTDTNICLSTGTEILTMRTGKIMEWFPAAVRVRLYNDRTGEHEEIVMPKRAVAIVENPLYAVINEPNSTMQRLIRKLSLLDLTDERTASGKLDLIIQLPYTTNSPLRMKQAERRLDQIQDQLVSSQYGIAYIAGSEKVTQLNRSVENNLLKHVEYLTSMLFSQLGITQSILDGTADDKTMLNYYNRTVEPIVSAFVDEMKRKFLTKTARSPEQRQSIMFFRNQFKLVPVAELAEIVDKFTRNEIATSNEMRQLLGWKPSKDPGADELRNKNLRVPSGDSGEEEQTSKEGEIQNEEKV